MDRKEKATRLHQQALQAAKRYFVAEADLLGVLQDMDRDRSYLELEHPSLFSYAVNALKLSESTALNFIQVARKAVSVPSLKQEIAAGRLSVSKARKIVPVLTVQNQSDWIEKAKTLSARVLEKEVARIAPQAARPDTIRHITEKRVALSLSLDEKVLEAFKRVQDLESQRLKRTVTFEETMAAMSAVYLQKNDPVENARRIEAKAQLKLSNAQSKHSDVTGHVRGGEKLKSNSQKADETPLPGQSLFKRVPIRAALSRQVVLRDGGACTHLNEKGMRCGRTRWLDIHHVRPLSEGGTDAIENLTTLCSAHHRMEHRC